MDWIIVISGMIYLISEFASKWLFLWVCLHSFVIKYEIYADKFILPNSFLDSSLANSIIFVSREIPVLDSKFYPSFNEILLIYSMN